MVVWLTQHQEIVDQTEPSHTQRCHTRCGTIVSLVFGRTAQPPNREMLDVPAIITYVWYWWIEYGHVIFTPFHGGIVLFWS